MMIQKLKFEDKEVNVENVEVATKAVIVKEDCDEEEKKSENKEDKDKEFENNVLENEGPPIINEEKRALEINNNEINKENNMSTKISDNISQNNIPISFEKKKSKKAVTKKKKEDVINVTDEEEGEDEEMFSIRDGEFVLGEGERIIASWTF